MAKSGFYNDNLYRDYPFVHLQTNELPDALIVDFGCIVGVTSGFVEGTHTVVLSRIRALDNLVEIEFTTTAPGLVDSVLRFSVDASAEKYTTVFATAVPTSTPSDIDCIVQCIDDCDTEPPTPCYTTSDWSGFLVIGDLSEIPALSSSESSCTVDDENVSSGTVHEFLGSVPVEPSLIKNLNNSFIRTINVANADRTRSTTPAECREHCWPFPLQTHYVNCSCATGSIRFVEGYNCCIEQNSQENVITINGCVGGGAGEPCDDALVTDNEAPPNDRTTLDGGLRCDEIVRTINGVGRRYFEILGGPGVEIIPVPDQNKIIIDINLESLALCVDLRDRSSSYQPIELSDGSSCDCGSSE